jgi:serine/threonine protein phosphatase PrpC
MGQRHFVAGFDELVVAGFDELAPDLRRRPNVGRHFRGATPQEACKKLVTKANRNGGEDNISVIVVAGAKEPTGAAGD